MKNLTEDDDLQIYTIGQHESYIFRVLSGLNLYRWLYNISCTTFLKQKTQNLSENIQFFIQLSL
jgi:hypothetical protein